MAAAKIKKGDRVVVLSGKDKGRTGKVVQVMPKDGKVWSSGVNVAARHRKPSQANPQGGHRAPGSAAARVEGRDRRPKTGKPTRVRFETQGRQEGPRRGEVRGEDRWLTRKRRSRRLSVPKTEKVEQVELVREAEKAEAEAIEARPKVGEAEVPKAEKVADQLARCPRTTRRG